MAMVCAGCHQEINSRRYLKCLLCKEHYDLECAGVSEKRFYNTMSIECKMSWKCHLCRSKEPKGDNSNTPIRPPLPLDNVRVPGNLYKQSQAQASSTDTNVTMRKRTPCYNKSPDSDEDSFVSPQGNTQTTPSQDNELISLQKFRCILYENNKDILCSIQNSFRNEIENAISKIKDEYTHIFEKISSDQMKFQQDLKSTNTKIHELERNCCSLKAELEKIQAEIHYLQSNKHIPTNKPDIENTDRIFVLHGFVENPWETEEEVIERVVNVFFDLLNVNLYECIEGAIFIGRKGNRRPLKIELLSKRMKKYIIDNTIYLKEAGFSATEYLSPSDLQIRRKLYSALQAARRNGQHAVIKSGRLFINGKEAETYPQPNDNRVKLNAGVLEDEKGTIGVRRSTSSQPSPPSPPPYFDSCAGAKRKGTVTESPKNTVGKKPTFRE